MVISFIKFVPDLMERLKSPSFLKKIISVNPVLTWRGITDIGCVFCHYFANKLGSSYCLILLIRDILLYLFISWATGILYTSSTLRCKVDLLFWPFKDYWRNRAECNHWVCSGLQSADPRCSHLINYIFSWNQVRGKNDCAKFLTLPLSMDWI